MGAGPVQERGCRRRRPVHGPRQPPHPLRLRLAGPAQLLDYKQRWARLRPVQVNRWRRYLDGDIRQSRPAVRRQGANRRGRVAREAGARVGHHRVGGVRHLPLRRRRGHLAACKHRPGPARAPVVLLAHLCRSHGLGDGLGAQFQVLEVNRWREDLLRGHDAPRRQPRPVDRSPEYSADDRGQRRRRHGDTQRRRFVVNPVQPAYLPVLPRRDRQSVPLQGIRDAAGQLHHQRPLPHRKGRHPVDRLLPGRQRREWPHCCASRQLRRSVLRRDRERAGRRRVPDPLRPRHGPVEDCHRVAGAHLRLRGQGPQVQVPVDIPHSVLAPRLERAVRGGQHTLQVHGRGQQLGADQPGPDPQRRHQDGGRRRSLQQGDDRRRDLRHDFRIRRVPA